MSDARAGVVGVAMRHRLAVLAGVVVAAAGAITATALASAGGPTGGSHTVTMRIADATTGAHYLFRSTVLDRAYGRLDAAPTGARDGRRAPTGLSCARVAFAGGRGLCVTGSPGLFGSTRAVVFTASFQTTATIPLAGYPSRAQVAPDGRLGAVTDFVSGDSYASAAFSTRTTILDLAAGRPLFDLERLHVAEGGRSFADVNFNFWGVTFAPDSRHFYATLGSGSATYLIEGDVTTRQAVVLRRGVECPSLSPDATRLAFKSRVPGGWRLSVLDLSTLQARPLAEVRSVDDQATWLDNRTVAYGLPRASSAGSTPALSAGGSIPTDMWSVPADGSGRPTLLLPGAWSAVLVH